MAVEYLLTLRTASLKGLLKTIFRWKGSVYKLIWKEFLLYFGAFYTFQVIYIVLPFEWKHYYLFAVEYCQRFGDTIPVSLFLGFYVTKVISRYLEQFMNLPFITTVSIPISVVVEGDDEECRKIRRSMVRYCNLSLAMVFNAISYPVKKRFPTYQHMTSAGVMQGNEKELISSLNTVYHKFFVPLLWTNNLAVKARNQNRIKDDHQLTYLITHIVNLYEGMLNLTLYDFVQLPLVYTQAVTLCVYTFFFSCLLSRQEVDGRTHKAEISFPFFTFLQFFFYVGWLKVAEEMLNPYGEDDSDFDTNSLIDYFVQAGYMMVDEVHFEPPEIQKDMHFDIDTMDADYLKMLAHARPKNMPGMSLMEGMNKKLQFENLDMFLPQDIRLLFEEDSEDSDTHKFTCHRKKKINIFVKPAENSPTTEPKYFKLFEQP